MSLDKVLQHIEDKLHISDKTSICTLFAYNTTGKTRLSKLFEEIILIVLKFYVTIPFLKIFFTGIMKSIY